MDTNQYTWTRGSACGEAEVHAVIFTMRGMLTTRCLCGHVAVRVDTRRGACGYDAVHVVTAQCLRIRGGAGGHEVMCMWTRDRVRISTTQCVYGHEAVCICKHDAVRVWTPSGRHLNARRCMWPRRHACGHDAAHADRRRCILACSRRGACKHDALCVNTSQCVCGHEAVHVAPTQCVWTRRSPCKHGTVRVWSRRSPCKHGTVRVWTRRSTCKHGPVDLYTRQCMPFRRSARGYDAVHVDKRRCMRSFSR